MTETQHASELESAMDNLEALLETVSVARQKVRERRRRAVPDRAPRRPVEPIDWVVDEDPLEPEQSGPETSPEDESAEDGAGETPIEEESAGVADALPPASEEVRRIMAEMAVEGKHLDELQATVHSAGEAGAVAVDDPASRYRAFRAAAEGMVAEDSTTAQRARAVLETSEHEALEVHDAEGEELHRQLTDVRQSGLSQQQQATLFADRIAAVHMQQTVDRAVDQAEQTVDRVERERQAERERSVGSDFTSEFRLPLAAGAAGMAAAYGDDALESMERYAEELGARIEDGEIVVPVSGEGNDLEASMDASVSAWRSVTAEELAQAAVGGDEPTNLVYIGMVETGGPLVGSDGVVPLPGATAGQIRPTEDGLVVDASVSEAQVSPVLWEQLRNEFGDPEEGTGLVHVPVSADPHADPAVEISAAMEDMPASLYAKNEEYEQQLLVRQEAAAAAEDPGVWVQPASEDNFIDLVEKQRADGSIEAMVWVDAQQQPTTHPDGVPSVWLDEDGNVSSFGHYEDGHPEGTWGWRDPETGTFASVRAQMGEEGPVEGTLQHRDSPEDGWTDVLPQGSDEPSSGSAGYGEMGLDAGPENTDTSPTPGPSQAGPSTTPPLPDPSDPSRGPRMR